MRKIYLSLLLSLYSINYFAQWAQQNSTIITHLQCVDFLNSNIGLVGGHDLVKTIDGGTTWDTISYTGPLVNYYNGNVYYGIKVISNNIFVAAGWNVWDNASIIMYSSDAGITWSMTHQGSFGSGIQDLYFRNNNIGFAVGINGLILKTTDGGLNWFPVISGTSQTLFSITFSDSFHGYIAGDNVIITTNDGGINWTTNTFNDVGQCVSGKDSVIYLAGVNKLWKSSNYGVTWSDISAPVNIYGPIYALNKDTVYTTDYERIFCGNSGLSFWSSFPSSSVNKFNDIFMVNNNIGYAVGDNGAIFRTSNGGWPGTPVSDFYTDTNIVCQYDSITFQNKTEPGHSYQWLLNGNLVSTDYNATIIFNTSGNNTISLIVNDGSYIDTSQFVINVIAQPIATAFSTTLTNDTLCPNNSTTINVVNSILGEKYQLFSGNTPIGAAQNGNGSTLIFNTGLLTSTTILTTKGMVYNDCDTNYFSVNDTIIVVPNAISNTPFQANDTLLCLNDSTNIIIQNSQLNYTYELIKNGSNTGASITGNGSNIILNTGAINTSNSYQILATNHHGCSIILDSSITINIDSVIADFTLDTNNFFIGDTLTFTNNSIGNNYSWNFGVGSNPSISSIQNPHTTYNLSGTYKEITLTISSSFGCSDTMTQTVNVYEPPSSGIGQLCWADTLEYTHSGINGLGYKILDQHVDNVGNTYVTGYYYEPNWPTAYSMFLIKYDNNGNTVWIKKQKQTDYLVSTDQYKSSYGTCITTDLEGNIYLGGSFASKKFKLGTSTLTFSRSALQAFVVKYDSLGNTLWTIHGRPQTTTSSNDFIGISDIMFINNSEIYIASRGIRPVFFFPGSNSINFPNKHQVFVFKINSNGNYVNSLAAGALYNSSSVVFDKLYGPPNANSTDKLTCTSPKLAKSSCNDILIIGSYNTQAVFDTITISANGFQNGYVAIADRDLMAWKNAFTTYSRHYSTHQYICEPAFPIYSVDKNDNLYLSLNWLAISSVTPPIDAIYYDNIIHRELSGSLIMKYNLNGSLQWANKSPINFIKSIYSTNNNEVLLYGEYNNTLGLSSLPNSAYGIPSNGGSDIFMGSINSNGGVNWLRNMGNTKEDRAFKMAGNNCGDIYFSGYLSDTVSMDGINIYAGTNNLFIAKYSTNNTCAQTCSSFALNFTPCSLDDDSSLCSNQNIEITWDIDGFDNTVNLTYSIDSGITYTNIITSYSINNSSYNWNIPDSLFVGQWIFIQATTFPSNLSDSFWIYLLPSYNIQQANLSICQGDSILIYGTYQNTSGVYYDSLQTINGCDSILSTTLTVNPLPNVTLANFNPDTICSNSNAVTLPNGSPSGGIYSGTGVNGGTFDPNTAGIGTHSVFYTYTDINSCINSDSTFITVEQCVGIDDLANDLGILIYPNPNTGLFTIEKSSELDKKVNISLLDASSRVIINKIIPKGQQKIEMDITLHSKGVYYLQLTVGKEIFVKQILKN